ncbi:ABA4-like family protein [Pedobacter sp. MR2016-24]|uniref:ABA4-like family protein n=1 Tax=Pedobacter sp. MR2016-24 TaxID=2994466 RepID=UPI0022466525|nr:ABA4-like family protein [Pedobacter sp. MR2016-24]MCX2483240.1 ABA4-like family protein [Pedobacter sp. MR2016-24]
METSQIFSLVSSLAAVQWLLLIILPKWRVTLWLISYPLVPIVLSVIYCIYITGFFSISGGGYGSLQQVRTLFANDSLLLAGWVHYLAFDLLIGFAIIRSSQERNISHWLVIPCLVMTFMFGPVGFLLYQIIKKIRQ